MDSSRIELVDLGDCARDSIWGYHLDHVEVGGVVGVSAFQGNAVDALEVDMKVLNGNIDVLAIFRRVSVGLGRVPSLWEGFACIVAVPVVLLQRHRELGRATVLNVNILVLELGQVATSFSALVTKEAVQVSR